MGPLEMAHRFRHSRLRLATWLTALGLLGCDGDLPEDSPDADSDTAVAAPPSAPVEAPVAAPPVLAAAAALRPARAPLPPPPDPEAEAREAARAAQAEFDAAWPLHGVCYHHLAHVYARPDRRSAIVGYMRRGAQFRAKDGLRGNGCARGWHEVVGGGFVCRGEGYQLGADVQTFEPSPVPPALDSALPYAYAYVGRSEAPQYWRIPTPAEEQSAATLMSTLRAARDAVRASAEGGSEEPDPGLEAPPQEQSSEEQPASPLPSYFRMRMESGFYVSVDQEERDGTRRFFRTIRGGYVPAEAMTVVTPPAMRGVVLGGAWRTPLGFVYRRGATSLNRDPVSGALSPGSALDYHAPLLLQDDVIERRGNRHRITRQGMVVRENALRLVELISRPRAIPQEDRWIHVDLSNQTLVAYEGDRAAFATLVSTGREGFGTPIGTYRIQSKHVSTTMDDTDSTSEAYSIEDVPWTMYFEGSYALHAAFWHDNFGRPRSHGCVNLAPADARWLFQWTTPTLPPGWHGIVATQRRQGTWVHVTE